jgi:hypothetical protein
MRGSGVVEVMATLGERRRGEEARIRGIELPSAVCCPAVLGFDKLNRRPPSAVCGLLSAVYRLRSAGNI